MNNERMMTKLQELRDEMQRFVSENDFFDNHKNITLNTYSILR